MKAHIGVDAGSGRRSTYKKYGKLSVLYRIKRRIEKAKAQLVTLYALSNLWMARRHLLANAGEVRL